MPSIRSGRMRRPCSVWWTSSLSPATAAPIQPPRQTVARRVVRREPAARVLSTHTVLPTGGFGGSPPPVVSGSKAPILIVRGRGPLRWTRPLSLRPQLGGVPNLPPPPTQRVRPRPLVAPDPRQMLRFRPVIHRGKAQAVAVPGQNIDVVPYRAPRRGPVPPIVRPQLGRASIMFPPPPAIVRVPRQPVRPTVVIQLDSGAGIRPILPGRPQRIRPRPIVAPALPAKSYQVILSTAGAFQRMRLPRPLVVPRPRPPARPTVVIQVDSGAGYQTTQRRPVVVRPPSGLKLPPKPIGPALHHLLASPALHGPMPRPFIAFRPPGPVQPPRRIQAAPPQPIPTVNPPQPGVNPMPPDLVAACIAWLRLQPAIVPAFGDAVATEKFFSDVAVRNTAPPYLEFHEPDEDEGYESADDTGLPSSLRDGRLGMQIVGSTALGKLGTRQLSERVAAVLNDAPLTFLDGTLVYLRRSNRNFPTFKDTGPKDNVVVWKRVIEFHYQIESWAPQF